MNRLKFRTKAQLHKAAAVEPANLFPKQKETVEPGRRSYFVKDLIWDSVRFGKRKRLHYYCKRPRGARQWAYRSTVGKRNYHQRFGLHIRNSDPLRWQPLMGFHSFNQFNPTHIEQLIHPHTHHHEHMGFSGLQFSVSGSGHAGHGALDTGHSTPDTGHHEHPHHHLHHGHTSVSSYQLPVPGHSTPDTGHSHGTCSFTESFFQSAWAGLNAYSSAMAKKMAKQIIAIIRLAARHQHVERNHQKAINQKTHLHHPGQHANMHIPAHLTRIKSHSLAQSAKWNMPHAPNIKFSSPKTTFAAEYPNAKAGSPSKSHASSINHSTYHPKALKFKAARMQAEPANISGSAPAFRLQKTSAQIFKPGKVQKSRDVAPDIAGTNLYHIAQDFTQRLVFPKLASEAALPSE